MGFFTFYAILHLFYIPYNEKTGEFLKKYKAKGRDLSLWIERDSSSGTVFREFLESYAIKKYKYAPSPDSSAFHNFPEVLNLIKDDLKLKIEAKYHFLVDLAFSHLIYPIPIPKNILEMTEEEREERGIDIYLEVGIGRFLRIGDLFFIRNESPMIELPSWPSEYNFDLKKSHYKKGVLDYTKKAYKRWRKRIAEEHEMAGRELPKKKLVGVDFYRHIWDFKESIDKHGAVFQLIPNTQDCNLTSQLFELYSNLSKEFKDYKLIEWEFVENDRKTISDYLETTRDFFAVYKKDYKKA